MASEALISQHYIQLLWQSDFRMYKRECPFLAWRPSSLQDLELEKHLMQQLHYKRVQAGRIHRQLNKLLVEQQAYNRSAFNLATEKGYVDITRAILSYIDPNKKKELVNVWFHSHCCNGQLEYQPSKDIVILLLDNLSIEEKIQLFTGDSGPYYQYSCNKLLNAAIEYWNHEILQVMLDSLENEENRFKILSSRNYRGHTPLHVAIRERKNEAFEVILNSLEGEKLCECLQICDHEMRGNGWTPVNLAALHSHHDMIEKMKQTLTPEQWLKLLSASLEIRGSDLLQEHKIVAQIWCALNVTNLTERQQRVLEIIQDEPLSVGQIKELSPTSDQYVIPYNQLKSKRYAIVLFNSHNRPGSVLEADNFEASLETAGFKVYKMQWMSAIELQNMIDSAVRVIMGDCSLLVVCVMSHGHRGVLKGSDASEIPINNLIHQITLSIPEYVPLVMVIQACQQLTTHGVVPTIHSEEADPAVPGQAADRHINKHIVLTRPHTILALSTVMGGEAIRGAFTGALARQISTADGVTDINTMFNRAVGEMQRTEPMCVKQWAEIRHVTNKRLILPPAVTYHTNSSNV